MNLSRLNFFSPGPFIISGRRDFLAAFKAGESRSSFSKRTNCVSIPRGLEFPRFFVLRFKAKRNNKIIAVTAFALAMSSGPMLAIRDCRGRKVFYITTRGTEKSGQGVIRLFKV